MAASDVQRRKLPRATQSAQIYADLRDEILAALTTHLRDPTSTYRKARAAGETTAPKVQYRNP